MVGNAPSLSPVPREGHVPVTDGELYFREIGQGPPLLVLHGGPDFDHHYFLPDLDRLSDSFRLVYYDQRGRGKSRGHGASEDVTIESEIADLERVREFFRLESVAILGHSWGGVLAMEYAIRHPHRVSRVILMNPGPASHSDYMLLRQERRRKWPADVAELKALSSTAKYAEADPATVADYYRIHFRATVRQPEQLDRLIERLSRSFTNEAILEARRIEERLMNETWWSSDYDLLPRLRRLDVPTLLIHGDHDLIPVECAAHIAQAIPGARMIVLKETGHFSYLESPEAVGKAIADFFLRT